MKTNMLLMKTNMLLKDTFPAKAQFISANERLDYILYIVGKVAMRQF